MKIYTLLFIAMLSVSTSPIIARYLENVPAVTMSFWRMWFGALILWGISFLKKQPSLKNKNLTRTLIAGILLGIHFALFFGAIKLTTIANATFLGTLAPIFTYCIEKFILKRSHSNILLIGLGFAIFGATIIISNQFDFSNDYTIGNLLAVACSIFLGVGFIISENVRKEVGTISYSRTLFTTAAVTLLIISFFTNSSLVGYSKMDFMGLLLLGIIPTLLGHGSMYFAIRYVSPTVVASTPMGEPILASIMAWFLFNEAISTTIIIGGTVTLIGLLLLVKEKNNLKQLRIK